MVVRTCVSSGGSVEFQEKLLCIQLLNEKKTSVSYCNLYQSLNSITTTVDSMSTVTTACMRIGLGYC